MTGRATITDIGPEELESLIRFAYTDSLDNDDLTLELLIAADKYNFAGFVISTSFQTIFSPKFLLDSSYQQLVNF